MGKEDEAELGGGTDEFGWEYYTPDAAAKTFWNAIQVMGRTMADRAEAAEAERDKRAKEIKVLRKLYLDEAGKVIVEKCKHIEAVAKYEAVIDEAKFLRDRISEMEWVDDEVFRQFDGHVSPSISRLKDAITTLDEESKS